MSYKARQTSSDQQGAAGRITPKDRLAALAMVQQGHVFDLDHEIRAGAPHYERVQPPYLQSLWSRAESVIRALRRQNITNDPGVNVEHVHMTFHVGTHVDALGHFTIGDKMYGGHSAKEIIGDLGLRRLGIEQVPTLITRGICIDVADLDGEEYLRAGRVVTIDDIRRALDSIQIELRSGDVVLIRTGWGSFYMTDNRRYCNGEPGIDLPAARWLIEHGACAIGADNMAIEVLPNPDPMIMMPVHQHALVEQGVYLIENLNLQELAKSAIHSFCFVMLSVKFRGATASPVRPVALI